ncbi:cupin domain-containing protein [Capnocytophaga sp.]|uniref:cupin domain-containing protein n=1 Tax=Capnocytophaga sp. TaxID=44737 RepID=UPI0026DBF60E|nr:cupin domain-containing protein [Capnocytophaga sp.]MDO5104313.1 cupin domain-containing protein [Capnocytophaga sp.]
MTVNSFTDNLVFSSEKIQTQVVLESDFSKEIRITMAKGQVMKEHQTKFPIVVHVLEGIVDFGVGGTIHTMKKGAIITLKGNVPHDLKALENSIIRLTLSKQDAVSRVEEVIKQSEKQ